MEESKRLPSVCFLGGGSCRKGFHKVGGHNKMEMVEKIQETKNTSPLQLGTGEYLVILVLVCSFFGLCTVRQGRLL